MVTGIFKLLLPSFSKKINLITAFVCKYNTDTKNSLQTNYYYYNIRLMAIFQDNLGKPAPKR